MRVIIPARLSSKKDGREGIGLDTQDQRSRDFCEREGHTVVTVTRDTISGAVAPMDRRQLGPWVTDPAKIAQYDAIVAYKSDRLSRGEDYDWSRIETWAVDHGKKLIIVGFDGGVQFPSRNDSDYWQWAAMKRQAGRERADIKERTARAHGAIRAQGGFIGRKPWGYDITGEKYAKYLVHSAEGTRYAKPVFTRIARGASLGEAAAWLEQETGRRWWAKTVGEIVRNPVYKRVQEYAGHKCPPLVPAALWRLANESLDTRPQRRSGGRRTEGALLKGIIFCPRCNSPMLRNDGGSYRCSGRGPQRKGCGNMVRLEAVDSVVDRWMSVWDEEVTVPVLVAGTDDAELEDVLQQIRDLAARDLPDADYDAELARLRAERDRLKALPREDDRWEDRPAGFTYVDRWEAQSGPERTAWLKSVGVTVWAVREEDSGVRVEIRDRSGFAVRTAFV